MTPYRPVLLSMLLFSLTVSCGDTAVPVTPKRAPSSATPQAKPPQANALQAKAPQAKAPKAETVLYVNGHKLNAEEAKWVAFIATDIVPLLDGNRDQRIAMASLATWWTLKEGVLRCSNPHLHSVCERDKGPDIRLKPLEVCGQGKAWQVGLAAAQVPNHSLDEVRALAKKLLPYKSEQEILTDVASLAGFPRDSAVATQIINSRGLLRKSWLVRHPAIGVTFAEQEARDECIAVERAEKWCFHPTRDPAKLYAPNKSAALRAIADIRNILATYAP